MSLMDFTSDVDNDKDIRVIEAQLRTTIREALLRAMRSPIPLLEDKNYFHILIDPWLRGSQSDVAHFFSQQWHACESAVQTIEELEKRIAEIEDLTSSPI